MVAYVGVDFSSRVMPHTSNTPVEMADGTTRVRRIEAGGGGQDIQVIHSPITETEAQTLRDYYTANRNNAIDLTAVDGVAYVCRFRGDYQMRSAGTLSGDLLMATATFSAQIAADQAALNIIQPDVDLDRVYNAATSFIPARAYGGVPPYSYGVVGLPSGASYNSSNHTVNIAAGNDASSDNFTVQATDSLGDTAQSTGQLTFNTHPMLELSQSDTSGYASGAATTVTLSAATGGSGTYTYSVSGLPTGITFTASARRINISSELSGSAEISYTVTDSAGESETVGFTLTYQTTEAPLLAQNDVTLIAVGQSASTTLAAALGGTTPYTYSMSGLPTGASFNAGTRVLTISANQYNAGTNVSYSVTDGGSPAQTTTVTFSLAFKTTANLTLSQGNVTVAPGNIAGSATLNAASGGAGTLTYAVTGLPTGITFTASARRINIPSGQTGSAEITYTVTDGSGTSASTTFTLTYDTSTVALVAQNLNYSTLSALTAAWTALDQPKYYQGYFTPVSGGTAPYTYVLSLGDSGTFWNNNSSENIIYDGTLHPTNGRVWVEGGSTIGVQVLMRDAGSNALSLTGVINAHVACSYTATDATGAQITGQIDIDLDETVS